MNFSKCRHSCVTVLSLLWSRLSSSNSASPGQLWQREWHFQFSFLHQFWANSAARLYWKLFNWNMSFTTRLSNIFQSTLEKDWWKITNIWSIEKFANMRLLNLLAIFCSCTVLCSVNQGIYSSWKIVCNDSGVLINWFSQARKTISSASSCIYWLFLLQIILLLILPTATNSNKNFWL